MEEDIKRKIDSDFRSNALSAKKILEDFEEETRLSPRISRCIVHLADGSIEKMKVAIEEAKIDWRDIIGEAESYNFEFNKPFSPNV